jgi:hypothetical protein
MPWAAATAWASRIWWKTARGMKSRGVYETPGGAILMQAHKVLESITHRTGRRCTTSMQVALKSPIWFISASGSPPLCVRPVRLRGCDPKTVSGTVKLKLYKGNIINAGVWSDYSLYSESIATFGAGGIYNQKDSAGFINLSACRHRPALAGRGASKDPWQGIPGDILTRSFSCQNPLASLAGASDRAAAAGRRCIFRRACRRKIRILAFLTGLQSPL